MDQTFESLNERGYAIARSVITTEEVAHASEALQALPTCAGTRNLLEHSWVQALARQVRRSAVVERAFVSSPVAVQCTLFDKTENQNWLVALHQDLSIPVSARVNHPLLGAWSKKEGQHYVQAPVSLLESLLAVRVHIDDCGPESGPLRVVPGSHRHGRLVEIDARRLREALGEVTCSVGAGSALVMRPLLLHASSKASIPRRRRVLHFLFGPPSLGFGLEWRHAV